MLGAEWLNLPGDKKKPYLETADKDKERYILEMKDYNIIHPPQPKKPKSSGSGLAAIANTKEEIEKVVPSLEQVRFKYLPTNF